MALTIIIYCITVSVGQGSRQGLLSPQLQDLSQVAVKGVS